MDEEHLAITQRGINKAVDILLDRVEQLGSDRFYALVDGRIPQRGLTYEEAARVLLTWASSMNEKITQAEAAAYYDAILVAVSRGDWR
jgi:hypothetical protein